MLDERKSEVLRALVGEHIRTGEPVSSHSVLDRSRLPVSSATIRNELVALEREGFIQQPHTSAGRVPTAKGYRYYVDHLSPSRLGSAARTRVDQFFSVVHLELGRLLQETSDFLAEMARYPAVVLGPGLLGETLRGVHLVHLGSQVFLVVLVTDAGRVSQELVRMAIPITPQALEGAERFLGERLAGQTLAAAAGAAEEAEDEAPMVFGIVRAVAEVAVRSEHVSRQVYLGGTSQLASLWEDLAELHRILELLERQPLVLRLLEEAGPETTIRIGSELPVRDKVDLAVVAASYDVAGRPTGRVGVLGPMRMDYRRAISVVKEVSEGLAENLGA
ncbi:MAG: heat-inducible transcriptional repressor HrcA [Actinomycetota bacterium]|nr:heat-inducible transcriptional repressor HrcA [Actinomycetota bacterium]